MDLLKWGQRRDGTSLLGGNAERDGAVQPAFQPKSFYDSVLLCNEKKCHLGMTGICCLMNW